MSGYIVLCISLSHFLHCLLWHQCIPSCAFSVLPLPLDLFHIRIFGCSSYLTVSHGREHLSALSIVHLKGSSPQSLCRAVDVFPWSMYINCFFRTYIYFIRSLVMDFHWSLSSTIWLAFIQLLSTCLKSRFQYKMISFLFFHVLQTITKLIILLFFCSLSLAHDQFFPSIFFLILFENRQPPDFQEKSCINSFFMYSSLTSCMFFPCCCISLSGY